MTISQPERTQVTAPASSGGAASGASAARDAAPTSSRDAARSAARGAAPTSSRDAGPGGLAAGGPRQAKLRVQRLDPLSVLKLAFLLSVAAGIAGVVLVAVLWMILNGMGVFSAVNDSIASLLGSGKKFDIMDYAGFSRVLSLSIVISFINVLLLTALATLAAFLYNICAGLVGGVNQTLTDD